MPRNSSPSSPIIYAGLSFVTYDGEPFDLGHGLTLMSTYAHLFAAPILAFKRASEGKPHPGPWRAAGGGGFSYDIEIELAVPATSELASGISAEDAVGLIGALLRLANYPFLMMPVLSDHSFDAAATSEREPVLRPFEIEPRIVGAPDGASQLKADDLNWVKSVWPRTAQLLLTCPPLGTALRAADACTVRGRRAAALLTAWGALEELFTADRTELRFRTSANIAAYLEPAGPKRLELFKLVSDLYKARSKAAHSAQDAEISALMHSWVILRNALVRMIDKGTVPTQADFERLLFCGEH